MIGKRAHRPQFPRQAVQQSVAAVSIVELRERFRPQPVTQATSRRAALSLRCPGTS
jgi:hypothetical protein